MWQVIHNAYIHSSTSLRKSLFKRMCTHVDDASPRVSYITASLYRELQKLKKKTSKANVN
ncbi:hypothetical protein EXN66_Car011859 [Channa argus]|uniref:Uncharacterized protein n=1 Tax=Channa argus TaxID=215402 RepID=A0A6G1Q1C7_CHAAH|nr:hypothetical protein EXN66_Car011859 [Channa argus]